MGKKKTDRPGAATARKKRLRLEDHSPIGLTEEQQRKLRELYRPLAHLAGESLPKRGRVDHRRIGVDRLLYIYLESLCHDAQLETGGPRRRTLTSLRRQTVRDLNKLCGRELSPEDMIKALAKHAPVPDFAASAIRRDYLRVTV